MITYQLELFDQVIEEITPILYKHWEEVAMWKDKVPLEPKWDFYKNAETFNNLYVLTARDTGRLIGYNIMLLHPSIHYNMVVASNDIIYVAEEYRSTRVGLRLICTMESILREKNVDVIQYHIKVYKDFSNLLEKLGYPVIEKICMKHLGV